MPEVIVSKVDGSGRKTEIISNGGSYTVRVTNGSGLVEVERDVGTNDEAIATIQNI